MSFTAMSPTSSEPNTGYSTPDRVSFCAMDDGSGGTMFVNGLGSAISGSVDLATLFGTAFRSIPLLRAFRSVASVQKACDQFNAFLNVSWVFLGSGGIDSVPAINYSRGATLSDTGVPYLQIAGPGVSSVWRFDLQLRHSIPG